jgi:hypothetical protein
MSVVIAERALQVHGQEGSKPGFVRLYAPQPARNEPDSEWICEYHLCWPGHEERYGICGVDSYQALLLAMKLVPTLISISADFKAGRLCELDSDSPLSDLELSFGFGPSEGKPQ